MRRKNIFAIVLIISALMLTVGCKKDEIIETPLADEGTDNAAADSPATDFFDDEDLSASTYNGEIPVPLCLVKNTFFLQDKGEDGKVYSSGVEELVKIATKKNVDFAAGAEEYPEIAKAIGEYMADTDDAYRAGLDEICKAAGEETNKTYLPYFCNQGLSVPRADSAVVSIVLKEDSFTGGAHGNAGISAVSFDTKTGKRLLLKYIVKDTSRLPKLIRDSIPSDVTLQAEDSYFKEIIDKDGKEGGATYVVDNAGLTFYFSPYEIAPYSDGIITVTIPFFKNNDLFYEKYATTMESYAAQIAAGIPYVDYTVSADEITPLTACSVTTGTKITSINISAGKYFDEQPVENGAYVNYTYFQTVDFGRFLYAEVTPYKGNQQIYIWRIDTQGDGISFIRKMDNVGSPVSKVADDFKYYYLPTHPEGLLLEMAGKQHEYFVGEGGEPEKSTGAGTPLGGDADSDESESDTENTNTQREIIEQGLDLGF